MVIGSSMVHGMMIFQWPASLIKVVEMAMRNFLWTGDVNKRDCITVAWAWVRSPMEEGGLGIKSLKMENHAFLYRLAWDILVRRSLNLCSYNGVFWIQWIEWKTLYLSHLFGKDFDNH